MGASLAEGVAASRACGLPAPLFFEADTLDELSIDAPTTAAFWFHLTDYTIFPHLQLFASAAELVEQLLSVDLEVVSRRMAEFNARTWRASATFYREALGALTGGDKCSAGVAGNADARVHQEVELPLTTRFLPQPGSDLEWSQ